jgi:hypothetical protein
MRSPGGTLADVAEGLGTAIDTGTDIRAQFTRIAGSDDPFGETLVTTAAIQGLEHARTQVALDHAHRDQRDRRGARRAALVNMPISRLGAAQRPVR